ncbi:helix-turn-helix transcriptional regulator [Streptomyces sp. HNM0574]|uniref:helix-turn-helix domain-containing protein n=1 Tax=Streptomyces sp. HNM0574 TaxID=2714954 RepID=UPI00146C5FD8|nr:helix-turn-helix transcriptional regulator [Streptomyces sp. HNM0574]
MSNWADLTTGKRIKALRGTDLTQQGLAEAAGVSYALIQKAEQDRGELSVGSLLKLAAALRTDVGVILGQQAPRRGMSRDTRTAVRRLSDAVHDSALGGWEGVEEPSTVSELSSAHDGMCAAYWRGDFVELSELTAKVVLEGSARYVQAVGCERERLGALLASAYQFASSTAMLLGQRDLALSALTSARYVEGASGDALLAAVTDSTLSWIHLRSAKVPQAVAVAERAASRIEPSFSKSPRPQLLMYGRLMIAAAVAASRRGDATSADDYLSQAHAAAARLGRDETAYGTHFGPTFANTEAVGIAVALGNHGKALQLAAHTRLPRSMPKLARNRYKLDVALAQCSAGLYDKAGDTLIEVGLDAPEWVKHQALPGVIGQRIAKVSTARVRSISEVIGVPLVA